MTIIYVTVPDEHLGILIGKTLVSEALVACANLLPPHTALYEWEGKLCEDKEHVLLLKTTSGKIAETQQRIEELHPYDTPCILSIPVSRANTAFEAWVQEHVATGRSEGTHTDQV